MRQMRNHQNNFLEKLRKINLKTNFFTNYKIVYSQMTPVLLPVDNPVESLVTAEFCNRFIFFFRRRGKIQQNKNVKMHSIRRTMRHPLKIPHQTITGRPRNCFGVPVSMGGHIRADSVTDHWYNPSLKSLISSGPEKNYNNHKSLMENVLENLGMLVKFNDFLVTKPNTLSYICRLNRFLYLVLPSW